MPSLLELTERVNKGELIDPQWLEVYQTSSNAAEKFLANHAGAMLDLRRSHTHLLEALEAVEYADQKVLFQFLSVLGFLGLTDQRTRPVLKFGAAALGRREIGLGLEAIQSSVVADLAGGGPFLTDAATAAFVAQQYARAAAAINWLPPAPCDWQNPQLRIGYVTSTLSEDEAPSRLAAALARHLDVKRFKLHVYATEAGVRREKQSFTQGPFVPPSTKKGREVIDLLTRRRAALWFAPLDSDLAVAARELATQLHKDQIDVLVLDAGPADPVAGVLAHWRPARTTLHVARRVALRGDFDAVAYFDAARQQADVPHWRPADTTVHVLPDGCEPLSPDAVVPQRSAYGIPDSGVILASVLESGDAIDWPAFADAVAGILRRNPSAVLVTAGDADASPLKRRLESAGFGKRAGFTGRRREVPELLRMSDVVLVPFGRTAAFGTLAALAAHKPVAALGDDAGEPQSAASVLGEPHVCTDAAAFAERVDRLIADPQLRAKAADASRAAATRCTAEQTVRALEGICRSLAERTIADAPAAKAA